MLSKHNSLEHLQNTHIYLAQIGWEICEPNHFCNGFRDMHLIHIIKKGKGSFNINKKKYNLGPHDIFYMPPNSIATYCSDAQEPWEYYYFAFNGSYSTEIIQHSIFKNNTFVAKLENCEQITDIIKSASEDIFTKEFPHLYGCEQLFKILPFFMIKSKDTVASNVYITEAENYIKIHFTEQIDIDKLAQILNIDRSYLYRIFKRHLGMSPKEYLNDLRLKHAKKLLLDTDLSTNEIAQMSGYQNYSPFYLLFFKKTGMAPQEFRLLQKGHKTTSENISITSIRIFEDIKQCKKILQYKTQNKPLNDTLIGCDFNPQKSFSYEILYDSNVYEFYAYRFEKKSDTIKYFKNAAKTKPLDTEKGFKIKTTSSSAELIVFCENCAYRVVACDIESLNTFRLYLNSIFTKIIAH